jgi:uncharacterized protein (TIGR02246 family)
MKMSKQDIENVEKQWLEAFNSGDTAGVAAQYTDNARLLAPNTDLIEGRAGIQEFIGGFVATKAQLSFKLIEVHEGGDLAVAIGRYEMDIPTDGETNHDSGKYIEVYRRQGDGSWLMVDDIFNSNLPAQ